MRVINVCLLSRMNKDSWKYRSGDAFLPASTVKFLHQYIVGNDKSLYYINLWHINHFFSGVLFGLFHLYLYKVSSPILFYIVIHTLWELWQLYIGMTVADLRGSIDILNDTVFGTLGVYLTLKLLEGKQ